ncbi:hypothetical protein VTI74DRAFT_8857 [Chaetomium olivicolor]
MFPSKLTLPAWLLLLGSTTAAPAPENVTARQAANPMDPWVTVNEDGVPKTVTPVQTTIKGTPTLLNAAPFEVTANVFTKRPFGILTTSTGAAQPVATNGKGAGALAACSNTNGDFKPFCLPKHNDVYYPGSVHHITWDPYFFSGSNSTVKVLGFYTSNTNSSSGPHSDLPTGEEEAFSSGNIAAAWGLYQWQVEKSLLSAQSASEVNITIHLVALPANGHAAQWLAGPTVTVKKKPGPPAYKSKAPDQTAIYIALPIVFGFAGVMIAASFFWNRQARIDIGSIVASARQRRSRRRKGGNVYQLVGSGSGNKSGKKNRGGRLDGSESEGEDNWNEGWSHEVPGRRDSEEGGRRKRA